MASPIEMIKGNARQTVYDTFKADSLAAEGWQRVDSLPLDKQRELRDRPPAPWTGYDDLTADEVVAQAQGMAPDRIDEVVRYESSTKGRMGIINRLLGRPATVEAPAKATKSEAPAAKGE